MENNEDTFKRFSVVMWGLAEEHGGKLSKDNMKMRFRALKEYSLKDVVSACNYLFTNRKEKFPPVPKTQEIIAAIEKIRGSVPPKAKAEIEADKVFDKLSKWGREAKPLFYDDITKYLMTERWKFRVIANYSAKEILWFRKDFVAAYVELFESEKDGADIKFISDANNNIKRLASSAVKRIDK